MSDFKLGKKIVAPVAPKPDVIERVGDVWSVNGKLQTANPHYKPPPPIPVPEVTEVPQGWEAVAEAINKALRKQEADGFSLSSWGVF